MRPLLTRRVLRLIIYNEIHSTSHCWAKPTKACFRTRHHAVIPKVSTRSFSLFGFSSKSKRLPKPVDYDPGYETILELNNRLKIGARPQPLEELTQAFARFFKCMRKEDQPLEDIQAQNALTAFEYIQKTSESGEDTALSDEEIRVALQALRVMTKEYKAEYKGHTELAKALFAELERRREANMSDAKSSADRDEDLVPFIIVMTQSGNSLHARDLIEQYWSECLRQSHGSLWPKLFRGLIRENRSEELQKTVEIMQQYNVSFGPRIHQAITIHFATAEDMEMTKVWYNHPIASEKSPTTYTDAFVLRLCIKKNELEWGESIFKSLLEKSEDGRHSLKIVLHWAAAKGKSVDEIEMMMQVMIKRSQERGTELRPHIDIINGLIEQANWRNDPYTAERYLALGQKWGLQPNCRTHLLQLDYRMKVGDVGGARTAYARLRGEEVPNQEDLPLINKLIVILCNQKPQNYDAIMGLVEDLGERQARFEHETVAGLSLIHLQREEMDELVDLLNTHAFHYGLDERASIRDVLINHCLNPATSISRAWETYNILRQTFAETDTSTRVTLMNNFFKRRRSDMATHVFGHMRQQQIKSLRPTIPTYAQCLAGLGQARDIESLEIVHNMIKIDSEIEPNTQLYNALMLGYSGCGDSYRALRFWQDIVHSREGPSYASIQIALSACESATGGEKEARDIWGTLQRFQIEVTREIYAAFVGALAGHNLFDECVGLINNARKEVGHEPDALM